MIITYIHHSSFLVETKTCYYLFDYEKGSMPHMNMQKPIFVLSSHGHYDHYNQEIFTILKNMNMQKISAILSDDIKVPADVEVLQVLPGKEYILRDGQKITTFKSTDEGVAFLIEEDEKIIYHAGDLNDWVWAGESDSYNEEMTKAYQEQIDLLAKKLCGREIDAAFVVLDPRQEKAYDRGMCHFLEKISVKEVYPMHYWEKPEIIKVLLEEHPEYKDKIKSAEHRKEV